jgi:hypothetical protein
MKKSESDSNLFEDSTPEKAPYIRKKPRSRGFSVGGGEGS